jgi:hypothetical protein
MTGSVGKDAAFSHGKVLRQLIIPALENGAGIREVTGG